MTKILILAEVKGAEIKKPSLELLSQAKRANLEADVLLIGNRVREQANTLSSHGAGVIYLAEDPSLELYHTLTYTALVEDASHQNQYSQIWLTASELGRDLTPRIAARLDAGAITDVTGFEDGDKWIAQRPAMSSKVIQHCSFKQQGMQVISFRAGVFETLADSELENRTAEIKELALPKTDLRAIVKGLVKESGGAIDLAEANIVVSVGRGASGPEGIELVRPLADLLGAAFGASRAVCDAGWMPHNCQVGQTGKVVAPDVYFAFGISGAIQHLAGMNGSKTIIAINQDTEAPIFKVADYGIVGDLFKVVPVLIEEIKKIKNPSAT